MWKLVSLTIPQSGEYNIPKLALVYYIRGWHTRPKFLYFKNEQTRSYQSRLAEHMIITNDNRAKEKHTWSYGLKRFIRKKESGFHKNCRETSDCQRRIFQYRTGTSSVASRCRLHGNCHSTRDSSTPWPTQSGAYVAKCIIGGIECDKKRIFPSKAFSITKKLFPFALKLYRKCENKKSQRLTRKEEQIQWWKSPNTPPPGIWPARVIFSCISYRGVLLRTMGCSPHSSKVNSPADSAASCWWIMQPRTPVHTGSCFSYRVNSITKGKNLTP